MGTTGEILVVDDDARMRGLVAKALVREGYSVRALPCARDILQALVEGSANSWSRTSECRRWTG